MKRNADMQVPYNDNGDLMHHAAGDVQWKSNDEFEATLTLTGTERGRSAAIFRWVDSDTGRHYPMFMTDVARLLMLGRVESGGVARGRWYVVKRGQNYGITPAEATKTTTEAPAEVSAA